MEIVVLYLFYSRCAAHTEVLAHLSTESVLNHQKTDSREETVLALVQTPVAVVVPVVGLVSRVLAPPGSSDETGFLFSRLSNAKVGQQDFLFFSFS
jgi:hypothetical protein